MAESGRLSELKSDLIGRTRLPLPPYVVALSGGADSATLAYLAADSGEPVSCVHVHHGLGPSDLLAQAATRVAEVIGVGLEIIEVEVPEGPSLENQARAVRYEALSTVVDTDSQVLLGHTSNDQAETVLMNLIRGTGTRGLAGIPYHRMPNFFRPILDISRSETRELAALAGLPFHDDPANADLSIRRNLVRTRLIPQLEALNPNVVTALARAAAQLGADEDLLDAMARSVPISADGSGASVAVAATLIVPEPVRWRVVRRLVGEVRSPDGITASECERITAVLTGAAAAAELEPGLRVTRDGPILRIARTGSGPGAATPH